MDRAQEMALRALGRAAAGSAARAGADSQSPSLVRRLATVTRANGDGTLDVDLGTAAVPLPMAGLRMTTACAGAKAGDRVVVDTQGRTSLVTGVLA